MRTDLEVREELFRLDKLLALELDFESSVRLTARKRALIWVLGGLDV